jgi:hypothetical protein
MSRRGRLLRWGAAALAAALAGFALPARAGSYDDFFLGIALDRPGIVGPLLARGFDVNARSPDGQHGLYLALREQSREVVALLLARPDLDVDASNAAGETPLMMAALKGDVATMQALIRRGAAVNRPGWTPLHYAATGQEPSTVKLLVGQGALLDARSPKGDTPLMMAAGYGSIDAAIWLARQGADASLRNEAGLSAADFARRAGRDDLADRLDALAASHPR